jgi:hypothetical protein
MEGITSFKWKHDPKDWLLLRADKFETFCDEHVDGMQKIITPDGYVLKFWYQGGLLYLQMEYPIAKEINILIHVEMTSP